MRRAALGGAGAWLAGCGSGSGSGGGAARDERVVIVGAGISGLHAAYRLNEVGLRPVVFEASERVGGRMLTDRASFAAGQTAELGAEFIDSVHVTMRSLVPELGLTLDDLHSGDDGAPLFFVDGHVAGLGELADGVGGFLAAVDEALGSLDDPSAPITYKNPNGAAALDALSARAWLDAAHVEGALRAALDAGLIAEYGLDPDDMSALDVVLAFGPGEVSDQRYRVRGGNDQIPTRLAERLDPAQLELGAALVSVRESADGRYRLAFDRGASTLEVLADHVVLAIPFTTLRRVELRLELPEPKRRAIDELGYGSCAKLVSGYASRPWRDAGRNGTAVTDLDAAVMWDATRGQPGEAGILTSFCGGQRGIDLGRGSPRDQLGGLLTEAEAVFPGLTAASTGAVVRQHWPSETWARASYSAYRIGQYTTIAGAEGERVANLHFCGEHTSADFQGFMEGAAATGAAAAAEIVADLGLTK